MVDADGDGGGGPAAPGSGGPPPGAGDQPALDPGPGVPVSAPVAAPPAALGGPGDRGHVYDYDEGPGEEEYDYHIDGYRDAEYPDDEYWGRYDRRGRGGGPGRGSRDVTAQRRSMRRRHPILAVFVALLLIVILLAGGIVLWGTHQIYPGGHEGDKVVVTIPAGASTTQIGVDLAQAGIIHAGGGFAFIKAGELFRYYVRVEGGSPLLPGTYLLAKNESYDEVINTLQAGPVVFTDKLVIPEGFTLREIAQRVARLPNMHLSAAVFLALSSSGSVRSPLEPPSVNNLEGLVFPATYTFLRTDNESTILEEMVGAFDQHMQALGLTAGAARLHMTPYQVITVASIIQGEAKFPDQFPDVASVIYNRLKAHIALGTDSTLVYALRLKNPNLKVAKLTFKEKSPYNTRLHKGLPPTPIDSPSLPALAAAITPPHTNLKYFLGVNSSGNLSFASTNAGFQKLLARCQANHLC
jgi:UPF0755 protein